MKTNNDILIMFLVISFVVGLVIGMTIIFYSQQRKDFRSNLYQSCLINCYESNKVNFIEVWTKCDALIRLNNNNCTIINKTKVQKYCGWICFNDSRAI